MIDASFTSVDTELPPLNVLVEVVGQYVPPGTGYPRSYRRQDGNEIRWDSTEWRGMVAITHWRLILRV